MRREIRAVIREMTWSLIITRERAKLWVMGPLQGHEDGRVLERLRGQGQYL